MSSFCFKTDLMTVVQRKEVMQRQKSMADININREIDCYSTVIQVSNLPNSVIAKLGSLPASDMHVARARGNRGVVQAGKSGSRAQTGDQETGKGSR